MVCRAARGGVEVRRALVVLVLAVSTWSCVSQQSEKTEAQQFASVVVDGKADVALVDGLAGIIHEGQ
jgi:hypothetical protein